jgi:hypothetical protein
MQTVYCFHTTAQRTTLQYSLNITTDGSQLIYPLGPIHLDHPVSDLGNYFASSCFVNLQVHTHRIRNEVSNIVALFSSIVGDRLTKLISAASPGRLINYN